MAFGGDPLFTLLFVPVAAAFRALLQIRAMRKRLGPLSPTSFNPIIASQTSDSEEHSVSARPSPAHAGGCGTLAPSAPWCWGQGGLGMPMLPGARVCLFNAN